MYMATDYTIHYVQYIGFLILLCDTPASSIALAKPPSLVCCNLDSRMHQHLSTFVKLASKRHLLNCCYTIMLVEVWSSIDEKLSDVVGALCFTTVEQEKLCSEY
jgi:hypothetical protein